MSAGIPNPEYEDATHAIWFMGLEPFEKFAKRELGVDLGEGTAPFDEIKIGPPPKSC